MGGQLSSGEREYATLVAQLRALDEDLETARVRARHGADGLDLDFHQHEPRRPISGEHVPLPDGAEIVIRPIEPGDAHELQVGFEHLSAMSRFRSFRARVARPTARQLVEVTHIDHDSHETFMAFAAPTGEGIAIASYVRAPDDPAEADFTCTVADQWQGRGVGTALAERLAARARAAGIVRFTAHVLVGNTAARRLLAHVADEVAEHRDGGAVEIIARPRDEPGG